MQQKALKMDGGAAFEAALVFEIVTNRRNLDEPSIEVFEQAGLIIIDDHRRIRMQRRHKNDAVAKRALLHRRLDLRSKIENFARLLGLDGDRLVVDLHIVRIQASVSRGVMVS